MRRVRRAGVRSGIALAVALVLAVIGATSVAQGARVAPQVDRPISAAAPLPTPPGRTERVSVGGDGGQGNAGSGGVSVVLEAMNGDQAISPDGRWVAFASTATNLIPGDPHPAGGMFLRDRQSPTTTAIPWVDGAVFPAGVIAAEPTISGDGSVVAFTAILTRAAAARVAGVATTVPYVLAWDRGTNTTSLVSVDASGRPTPGYQPSISADGRYVAYTRWFVDAAPPILSNLTTDGFASAGQFFVFGPSAPCTPHSATISVTATDGDEVVAGVTLFVQPTGSAAFSQEMSNVGGNLWRATVAVADSWSIGRISYWVQGRDQHGNVSPRLDATAPNLLDKGSCIS